MGKAERLSAPVSNDVRYWVRDRLFDSCQVGGDWPSESILPGVAFAAVGLDGAAVPQAVGDLLSSPAGDRDPLGERLCVETAGEFDRHQVQQIAGVSQRESPVDLEQFPVGDMVAAARPAPLGWRAPFLDFHECDFQCELRVGEDGGEVNQVVEQVQWRASLGTASSAHDLTLTGAGHDPFDGGDRLDDCYGMRLEEPADLIAEGSESGLLDFDDAAVGQNVDAVPIDFGFDLISRSSVDRFQLPVQRRFHYCRILTVEPMDRIEKRSSASRGLSPMQPESCAEAVVGLPWMLMSLPRSIQTFP